MKERTPNPEIEKMCNGCFFRNENGNCKLVNVYPSVQSERAKLGSCDESMLYSLDMRMFPLVEISIVSALRYRATTGIWEIKL